MAKADPFLHNTLPRTLDTFSLSLSHTHTLSLAPCSDLHRFSSVQKTLICTCASSLNTLIWKNVALIWRVALQYIIHLTFMWTKFSILAEVAGLKYFAWQFFYLKVKFKNKMKFHLYVRLRTLHLNTQSWTILHLDSIHFYEGIRKSYVRCSN
jgi:hypothetical protein